MDKNGLIWNNMEQYGVKYITIWTKIEYYMESYGIIWNNMEYHGIKWNNME